jgi:Tol biopolymer transport system component
MKGIFQAGNRTTQMQTMKSRICFLILGSMTFMGVAGISCSANNTNENPVTSMTVSATQVSVIPSNTPSPTLLPTVMFSQPTTIPYPTANAVKASAVAFIDLVGVDYSLWIANVDGSGERKLVDIETNSERISNDLLQWSPDGKWISYISGDDLWIISPDGLIKRKIVSVQDTKTKAIGKYEWSPDSSKIVYAQVANDNPTMVVGLLDLATGKVSKISSSPVPLTITLSWTPDGNRLLLSKDTLFVLFDINTRKFVGVKETPEHNQCTARWYDQLFWSPNGQRFVISWHGTGPYYSRYLCVNNLEGTNSYGINVDDDIYAMPPAWDKTGDYLYLVARHLNVQNPKLNPDLRLIRFNIETQKAERLLSLTDDTYPSDLFWDVSVSPDGRTIEIHGITAENQLSFIIMDIQSLSTEKFVIDFDIPISIQEGFYSHTFWTADNQNVVLSINGYFYSYDVKTGKAILFSGRHQVESWIVSPIAIHP